MTIWLTKAFGLLGDSCPQEPDLSVEDLLTLATQWTSPCKRLEYEIRRRANSHLRPQIIEVYASYVVCWCMLWCIFVRTFITNIYDHQLPTSIVRFLIRNISSALDANSDRVIATTVLKEQVGGEGVGWGHGGEEGEPGTSPLESEHQ